jgi:F-type H+-transporting ATPase subunit delta
LKDTVVAARYARAFFQASRSAKNAGKEDLRRFGQVLRTDVALDRLLRHPLLPLAEKKRRIAEAMGGSPSPAFERFLAILLKKKRIGLLPRIAALFEDFADAADNRRKVQMRSATPLSKEQVREWETRLSKAWGGEVRVEASVDESLLGGVILRQGDRVWDRSLRGQLRRLKTQLLETSKS